MTQFKNSKYYQDDVIIEGMMPPPPPIPGPPPPGMPGMPMDTAPQIPPMDPNMMGAAGLGPVSPPPPGGMPPTDPAMGAPMVDPATMDTTPPTDPSIPPDPETTLPQSPMGPDSAPNMIANELGPDVAAAVDTPQPTSVQPIEGEDGAFSDETLKSLGLGGTKKVMSPMEILDEQRRKREWKLSNCNKIEDDKKRTSCYKVVNRICVKNLLKAVNQCQGAINPGLCREIVQEEINAIMGFHKGI